MHPVRKQRLLIVVLILVMVSLAAGLLFYSLRDNLNLFYTPTQISQGEAPFDKQIRVGGMVVENSVHRAADGLTVTFEVTDYESVVTVTYTGILPALFAENDGVVATGKWSEAHIFEATEVLAKHDENYMPPEIRDTLKPQQKGQ